MSTKFTEALARLQATIEARKGADASTSYTAQLLADPARAAKKLGDDAVAQKLAAREGRSGLDEKAARSR